MNRTLSLRLFNQNFSIKEIYFVFLLGAAGLFLRLYNLEIIGLWMDEIHSAVGSDPDKTVKEVIEYCKQDQPPVFFLMLHGWYKTFGYNDFSGRLLVAITGTLGIAVMYFLGREFKNARVGLVAAFLTMINYFHVDHSRQVRFYPLVFLLAALSYLFYLRILKKRQLKDFIFYVLATSALLNSHYFGLVVFASQFILFAFIIVWKKITDIKFIAYSFLSGVAIGLSFLHWLPTVLSDLGIPQFHAQQLTWYFPAEFWWVYFRDIITCLLCALLGLVALREIYFRFALKSTREEDAVILGWIGLGFFIPLLYSWIRMPMLEYKYTFITLPAIFILVGAGFDALQFERLKLPIVVLLFSSFLVNAFFIKSIYFAKPIEEWREVAKEVIKTDNPNQLVFAKYAWYYRYYFKVYKSRHQPLEPQFANFDDQINQSKTLWVVTQTRYPDQGLSSFQQKYVDQNFKLTKEMTFTDAKAAYYVRLATDSLDSPD